MFRNSMAVLSYFLLISLLLLDVTAKKQKRNRQDAEEPVEKSLESTFDADLFRVQRRREEMKKRLNLCPPLVCTRRRLQALQWGRRLGFE